MANVIDTTDSVGSLIDIWFRLCSYSFYYCSETLDTLRPKRSEVFLFQEKRGVL